VLFIHQSRKQPASIQMITTAGAYCSGQEGMGKMDFTPTQTNAAVENAGQMTCFQARNSCFFSVR
jgi:hypothetical protein